MSKIELEGAIEEMNGFLSQAKNQRTISILNNALSTLKAELDAVPKPVVPVAVETVKETKPVNTQRVNYQSFASFSWDQNDSYVMIYFLDGLTGVEALPRDQIDCNFYANKVELCITGLQGRNYRWVQVLNRNINPTESKILIRKNRITLKLRKVRPNDIWTQLEPEKRPFEPSKIGDDPTAGLMDLMKNMYQTGDDTMKRTIAEAMMKAQSGETPKFSDDFSI